MSSIKGQIVFLGVDGATWDVINPLIDHGKLPNITKLIASGVHGNLQLFSSMFSQRV